MPSEAPPTPRSLADQELSSSSFFLVKARFLLFFFVDFFFIALQPLTDAKDAAPDRNVNVIRITYSKGFSSNSF